VKLQRAGLTPEVPQPPILAHTLCYCLGMQEQVTPRLQMQMLMLMLQLQWQWQWQWM